MKKLRTASRRRGAWRVLLLGLVLVAGCSKGRGNVSGVVNFKGKPLPAGTILFYDELNRVREGVIKDDGSYEVTDVATGKARVAVITPMPIEMRIPGLPSKPVAAPKTKPVQIPEKYGNPDSSGIHFDIGRGDNKYNVDL
jgi:hypothetical protein